MKQRHENYIRLVGGVMDYVQKIVDLAMREQRKIIIWGFARAGRFWRHLIEECDGRCKVEYIIDENQTLSICCDARPAIFRSSLLEYLDAKEYLILSTISGISDILDKAKRYGYQLGENLYDVYADIGESYIDYLQKKNKSVDFKSVLKDPCYGKNINPYTPFQNSCVDKVFNTIASLEDEISFFDIGCGKASVLVLAYMYGIEKLGGVELSRDVYAQACINTKSLGIECDLYNQSATECNALDDYNIFFFYNSFQGELCQIMFNNLEKSYERCNRNLYLVYANPFCHRMVLKNGYFKLYKQMLIDNFDPILNIYRIDRKAQ